MPSLLPAAGRRGFASAKMKSWGCRGSPGWAPGAQRAGSGHKPTPVRSGTSLRRSRSCAGSTSRSAGTGRRWRGTAVPACTASLPRSRAPSSPGGGKPDPTPALCRSPQAGGAEQDPGGVAGGAPPRHPLAQDRQAVSGGPYPVPSLLPGMIVPLGFDFLIFFLAFRVGFLPLGLDFYL